MYSSEATVSAYVRSISDGEEKRGGEGRGAEERRETKPLEVCKHGNLERNIFIHLPGKDFLNT